MATRTVTTKKSKSVGTMATCLMNYEHEMQMKWRDDEELLLSYLLFSEDDPESLKWGGIADEIYSRLKADDFYGEDYGKIYEICVTLRSKNIQPSTVVLGNEVGKLHREDLTIQSINKIGLRYQECALTNPHDIINSILMGSRTRKISKLLMNNYTDIAYGNEEVQQSTLDEWAKIVDTREMSILSADPSDDFHRECAEHRKWLRMSPEERDKSRFKTLAPAIDKMCYMRPSDMWILAGDTGAGKTIVATDFARSWAKQGKNVAYFSLEINRAMMIQRAICAESYVSADKYIKGDEEMTDDDWFNVEAAENVLAEGGHLRIIDNCPTLDSILAACRVLHAKNQLDIVIIDHLQHVDFAGKKTSNDNRYSNLCDMTMKLKAMAMRYNILVLSLSQFNRANENRMAGRPTLKALRDSGSIEQDADGVLAIYRKASLMDTGEGEKAVVMEKNGELLVLKNRLGETGVIPVKVLGECYKYLYGKSSKTFENAATEYVQNAYFGREAVPHTSAEYQQRELERMGKAMNNHMRRMEEAEQQSLAQEQQQYEDPEGGYGFEEEEKDDNE